MAVVSFPASARSNVARQGLVQAFSARLAAWRERRGREITVKRLNALDDRTLQDIGLDRAEIGSAVYDMRHERLRQYDERWWDPFSR